MTIASSGINSDIQRTLSFSTTALSARRCILSEDRTRCEVKARYRDHAIRHEPFRGGIRGHPSSPIWMSSSTAVTYERFTCLTEIHGVARRPRQYKPRILFRYYNRCIKNLQDFFAKNCNSSAKNYRYFESTVNGDGSFLVFVEVDLNSRT